MVVKVQGAKFVTCHGIYDEEKTVPNHFIVDCAVFFQNKDAELIVDYSVVYECMKSVMLTFKHTLEELINEIMISIKAKYSFIDKIDLEIKKINPPFSSDLAFVSVSESKVF